MRRARLNEVADVVELWQEAAAWLGEAGTDQWQYPVRVSGIQDEVAARTVWIVRDGDRLLSTVTPEDDVDPELWTAADQPDSALYLHRLVVTCDQRPADLGSAVLDWAARRAAAATKAWLRLDAWTSNPRLHAYYRQRQFRHVRTVRSAGVVSGALFERPVTVQVGRGPTLTDIPLER